MLQAGSYENAIVASEERVPQYMFWLDLNRITAQAWATSAARTNTRGMWSARRPCCSRTACRA